MRYLWVSSPWKCSRCHILRLHPLSSSRAGHIGVQRTMNFHHLPHTSPQLLSAFIRSLASDSLRSSSLETHRHRHFSLLLISAFSCQVSSPFSSHSPLLVFLLAFSHSSIFSACMSLRFTNCYSSSLASLE